MTTSIRIALGNGRVAYTWNSDDCLLRLQVHGGVPRELWKVSDEHEVAGQIFRAYEASKCLSDVP